MQELSVIIKTTTENTYGKAFKTGLGEVLTKARQTQNLRLEALSKELNISIKTLEEIELGRYTFHTGSIAKLLAKYKKELQISLIDKK